MKVLLLMFSSIVLLLSATILFLIIISSSSPVSAIFSAESLFEGAKDKVKVVFIAGFDNDDEETKKDFAISSSSSSSDSNSRLVPISLANGSKYHCHIPDRITTDESDVLWRQHLRKLQNRPLSDHLLKKVNSALSEMCFTYPDGWWSYKLCWGKSMRQFHADATGRVEAEFFIGKGPMMHIEDGATRELLYDVDPTNADRGRLVAEWFNGTVCDKTGSEREMALYLVCPEGASGSDAAATGNPRRQTTVQSNGNTNPSLQADLEIVETGICMYQATLKHQAFCNVPELRSRQKPETVVRCLDVTPSQGGVTQNEIIGDFKEIEGGSSSSDDGGDNNVADAKKSGSSSSDEEKTIEV